MRAKSSRLVFVTLGGVFFLIATVGIRAQNSSLQEGWNGAMQSSSTQSASFGFVDDVGYVSDSRCSGGCDICQVIKYALADYSTNNSNGDVIDTRGITSLTCTAADGNPWASLLGSNWLANTVLLPAGTINISASWVLPRNTRLVGEGPNSTTINANFSSGDIIDMGSSAGCSFNGITNCPDTIIEHLQVNGNGNTGVNGIVNGYGQELNRVNDVQIVGVNIGLSLNNFATNSGPYSNISMTNVAQCVNIGPGATSTPSSTRGVHGLKCATTGSSTPAIQISSPNNSLEDIYISGGSAQDGVLIATSGSSIPFGNVLLNISGSGLKNVIHIKSTSGANPSDISILGASSSQGTNLIKDEVASSTLTDTNLGMYILGEPVTYGSSNSIAGYSRFTTSINTTVPTWLVGTAAPSGSSCGAGTLYSCTSSACSHTLWECDGGGITWGVIK
jgi:hypothetical protein